MPLFRQLELDFLSSRTVVSDFPQPEVAGSGRSSVVGRARRLPFQPAASGALALQLPRGRDQRLEQQARDLLRANGAGRIASQVQVEWSSRMKSCAGRADYKTRLISLNPLLVEHGAREVDRTFLHELAHLLAQFRSGRKRIRPHGDEWRRACRDLGISDETRCHNLPLPVNRRTTRFLYRCPNCRRDFPRVRQIRRALACLACCRAHSKGAFDKRFELRLVYCRDTL